MIRNILLASAMMMGLSGAAMANSWDPPLPSHAHSEAVSQGMPSAVGQEQGESVIHYSGQAEGNLSAGTPVVIGHEGGSPIIVYR
ncbi:MAG TPA: hypothetical protein VNZ61_19795 [Roseomonas sp.]|nr:hypothetical protein [Roseomonas sp.]